MRPLPHSARPRGSALPTATVIVPTRGRPDALRRCVARLRAQDYPHDRFEIVVVLDGDDDAPAVAGDTVTVVRQEHAGPAAARNHGAEVASGELLAFTDDDCQPAADWLRLLAERCVRVPGAGAGGRTVCAVARNRWSETAEMIVALSRASADGDPARRPFLASNNLVLDAEGFRAIGGFDRSFRTAEDRDLCDRWTAAGGELVYEPAALVDHCHPHTARSFFATHRAYGAGAYRLVRARRSRSGGHGGLIDSAFYREVIRAARGASPGLAGRLAVWQMANVLGFVGEWARERGG